MIVQRMTAIWPRGGQWRTIGRSVHMIATPENEGGNDKRQSFGTPQPWLATADTISRSSSRGSFVTVVGGGSNLPIDQYPPIDCKRNSFVYPRRGGNGLTASVLRRLCHIFQPQWHRCCAVYSLVNPLGFSVVAAINSPATYHPRTRSRDRSQRPITCSPYHGAGEARLCWS